MSAIIGEDIIRAKSILDGGGVVAIPTETVYGLAANATDPLAVAKIFQVKNRPFFNPLIIHLPDIGKVEKYTKNIPSLAYDLWEKFSPGPLTILLEKVDNLPDIVTAGSPRVAVRIPDQPLTLQLLKRLDYPLAAPSANPFGYVSPTTAQHVADQLGDQIPYILNGGSSSVGVESTIIGFEDGETIIYRLGGTAIEEIEKVTRRVAYKTSVENIPDAPGMLKSHYSPNKGFIVGNIEELLKLQAGRSIGIISFSKPYLFKDVQNFVLSPKGSLEEAASNLFAAMRSLDDSKVNVILAEWLPDHGLGKAINDRLNRARLKND